MTNKFIKLADICARLPYGLKVDIGGGTYTLDSICDDDGFHFNIMDGGQPTFWEGYTLDQIKPYLFPLSSMTEEQKEEIEDKLTFPSNSNGGWIEILYNDKYEIPFWFIDFCNKNHLDYRGLIPMKLAIDATNLDIY